MDGFAFRDVGPRDFDFVLVGAAAYAREKHAGRIVGDGGGPVAFLRRSARRSSSARKTKNDTRRVDAVRKARPRPLDQRSRVRRTHLLARREASPVSKAHEIRATSKALTHLDLQGQPIGVERARERDRKPRSGSTSRQSRRRAVLEKWN